MVILLKEGDVRSKQDACSAQSLQTVGVSKAWLWRVMLRAFLQEPHPAMPSYHPHAQMASTTCTPGFWLSSPGQWLETGKFTLQTRPGCLYSSYLQYLGLFRAVSRADVPWANGSGKLISKVCISESCSTVTLWCIANAGPPRSQCVHVHWMTTQCLFATSERQQ